MTRYPFTTLANRVANTRRIFSEANLGRFVEEEEEIRYTTRKRRSQHFYLVLDDLWNRLRISVSAPICRSRFLSTNYLADRRTSSNVLLWGIASLRLHTIIWEANDRAVYTTDIFQSRELWQHQRGIEMTGSWWETVPFWSSAKFMVAFYLPPCRRLSFSFPRRDFRNGIVRWQTLPRLLARGLQ